MAPDKPPSKHPSQTMVLIDDSLNGTPAYLFDAPETVITAHDPAEIPAALTRLQQALDDGWYAAGFFSYELGYLMDASTKDMLPAGRSMPLLWFALSREPKRINAQEALMTQGTHEPGAYALGPVAPLPDRERYINDCNHVIGQIMAGNIYQANLTMRAGFDFSGDPRAFYADLRRRQPCAWGGMIETPDFSILSLSPEMFLEGRDGHIRTRPMKGTAPRGLYPADDDAQKTFLAGDPKNRAENLMIVDLMRNDLGRIATTGSVTVDRMFAIETYRTLHQMTSDISAQIKTGTTLTDILCALYPPGSVTGAPKLKAMQIIRELEATPRGVYCGAFGMLGPDRLVRLNVAIRTVTIRNGRGEIGIGSGVVADSDPCAEYDECLLKMRFLTGTAPDYGLIESMRWDDGYVLRDEHMARLAMSAAQLGFRHDPAAIAQALDALKPDALKPDAPHFVRLVLQADGRFDITTRPLAAQDSMRFVVSDERLDASDPLLYHKTTRRDLYEREYARVQGVADEVVFLNTQGELAEGSRTNIFIEKDGLLLTPPVSAGLLPGTLRGYLLDTGRARESVLHPADLAGKYPVFLGNSVRGLLPARMVVLAKTTV